MLTDFAWERQGNVMIQHKKLHDTRILKMRREVEYLGKARSESSTGSAS